MIFMIQADHAGAIVDAYAILKTIHNNRKDAVVRLVVNMVANQAQAEGGKVWFLYDTEFCLGRLGSF